jgi:hypothetical protein
MPAPNWTAIFTVREDLRPPGFDEVFLDMIERPWVRPQDRPKDSNGRRSRWPSLKHGAD